MHHKFSAVSFQPSATTETAAAINTPYDSEAS